MPSYKEEDFVAEIVEATYKKRIDDTNSLYMMSSKEIDHEALICFKYYFDISTSIEAIIRGISFKLSEDKKFINYYCKPTRNDKSFFLSLDELCVVIDINNIVELMKGKKEEFKQECKRVKMLESYTNYSISMDNMEYFKNTYILVRDTRNSLAHGFNVYSGTVDFTKDMLRNYIYIYFSLMSYYKSI